MLSKPNTLLRLKVLKRHLLPIPCRTISSETKTLRGFDSGVGFLPHMEKRHKGGEDAYCVTNTMIAVADGVGGWAQSGVDPAIYSKKLCLNIKNKYLEDIEKNSDDENSTVNDPCKLLAYAVAENHEKGSSTAIICMLDSNENYLHTANLGDSGYLLLRKNGFQINTLFRSKEQTHGFNFPFQVGVGGDDPLLADVQKHEIQNNDILIVGSDGLFDNMYDHQITDIINPFIKDKDEILDTELVAQLIAKQAETLSLDPNWKSPFAKHAYDNYYDFKGGKHDDITVLVSQIRIRDIE